MKNQKNIDVYDQILRGIEYKPAITIQDLPSLGRCYFETKFEHVKESLNTFKID